MNRLRETVQKVRGTSVSIASRTTGGGWLRFSHLPQAIAAQAIAAIDGHRQPRGFLVAPTRSRKVAGEFPAAA